MTAKLASKAEKIRKRRILRLWQGGIVGGEIRSGSGDFADIDDIGGVDDTVAEEVGGMGGVVVVVDVVICRPSGSG